MSMRSCTALKLINTTNTRGFRHAGSNQNTITPAQLNVQRSTYKQQTQTH